MTNYEMPKEKEMTVQEERAEFGIEKPKAKDTARLIWASKPKKEPNAKDLEFQTAEEVYPNVADIKDKKLDRFWSETKDISDDPNRLIWGDNLLVMQALLAQGYEGQIDLIYIDPPFNTGENFNFPNEVKIGNATFEKELPISERLAYTDTWNRGVDSFLDMLYPRLQLMFKLLSEKGSLYVHCDSNASHYIRILLDEIFGSSNFRANICWKKATKTTSFNNFGTEHDTILVYSRNNEKVVFHQLFRKLAEEQIAKNYKFVEKKDGDLVSLTKNQILGIEPLPDGRRLRMIPITNMNPNRPNLKFEFLGHVKVWAKTKEKLIDDYKRGLIVQTSPGTIPVKKQYLDDNKGVKINDLWIDIAPVQGAALENCDYPTQKPEALLERIMTISSDKDSLVADFFCGSGTTAAVAEKLSRKWITSDLSKTSIQVARGRFVNNYAKPFIIQNLGNYQRQLIYAKEVNLKQMYNIILKLYGATPRKDWQGFGISKEDNKTIVFVCEPDRPMTGKKAIDLAKSAKTADGKGYKRIVILAWDYEYNFDEDFNKLSKNAKKELADVEFKIIPSDVYKFLRSTKVGDQELANKITFYQKPYMRLSEPQIGSRSGDEIRVKIKVEQYVVMDIPVKDERKRPEIEKMLHKNFANLIDYWTVDWDYDGDVFRSKWQAIKDRKSNEPVTITADTTLKKGKKYTIAVRVVDVFGNDASLTKEIDLR